MANAFRFDGRKKAEEIDKQTQDILKVYEGRVKLASILVGDDKDSLTYLNLKKKKAEKVGAEVHVIQLPYDTSKEGIKEKIKILNNDSDYHGIMIQLPLPNNFSKEDQEEIINSISSVKDVDGMRIDSSFITPVVLASLLALKDSLVEEKKAPLKICVIGARGFVGMRMVKALGEESIKEKYLDGREIEVIEVAEANERKIAELTILSDIVIPATGQKELIKGSWVKDGVIVVDVGAPYPEFGQEVYAKASFYTPVPGGIGPLTISCLINNLANTIVR